MLVVTAKWGIGDGTVHAGPRAGVVEGFFAELRRAAWRAGFRRDGTYRSIDAAHLVFMGDTLDGLCSLAWHGGPRPWRGSRRAAAVAEAVAAGAARSGGRAWRHLRRLLRVGLAVPAADHRGRPLLGTFTRAAVKASCVIGERDGPLEATALAAAALRAGIRIGVTRDRGRDATAPIRDRPPTLLESLIVDLLVEFAFALRSFSAPRGPTPAWLHRMALAGIAELPRLVEAGEERFADRRLREAWLRAVAGWEARARFDPPAMPVPFDAVAAVAAWLERATREPALPLPASLSGLGLDGPALPPGSLPLAVATDDAFRDASAAEWWHGSAVTPAVVARIGALPDAPGIVDAA